MKTILLTGGTGVFGHYLVRDLLAANDVRLILLIRARSNAEARARLNGDIPPHVEVLAGDLLLEEFGIGRDRYGELQRSVTHILHAAASIRFNSSPEEALRNNVLTTKHVLALARECPRLVRFGFLSTALVAGKRTGTIKETELEHAAGFTNTYQQTKYDAERLVRSCKFPLVVFRPPFVHTPLTAQNAKMKSFLSVLISLIAKGKLPIVVGTSESPLDVVNGDEAARHICELFLKDTLSFDTYQITNARTIITNGALHSLIEKAVGSPIPVQYCGVGEAGVNLLRKKVLNNPELATIYERGASFLTDPAYPKFYDNSHTLEELSITEVGENPHSILQRIINETIWNSSK